MDVNNVKKGKYDRSKTAETLGYESKYNLNGALMPWQAEQALSHESTDQNINFFDPNNPPF